MRFILFLLRAAFQVCFVSASLVFCLTGHLIASPPQVSNIRAAQRAGTQLVDVYYDLADADSGALTVSVAVSTNGGASYTLPATSFSGALGPSVTPGANKRLAWNAGQDWPNRFSANVRFRVTADDRPPPPPVTLDLTAGGTGIRNDAIFTTSDNQSTGTGVIDSFVRVQDNGIADGYNASARPVMTDVNTSPQFTRDLKLSEVPEVTIGGVVYYEFLLDINQTNGSPLLSLDKLQIYTRPTALTTADTLIALTSSSTLRYDLVGSPGGNSEVLMNYSLNSGNGSGDLFAYIKKSLFGSENDYVYLYSQFGAKGGLYAENDGFEEWAVRVRSTVATGPDGGAMVASLDAGLGAPGTGLHSADSNITTVDTRLALSGSIFGQIFGGGAPVSNAQVRVLATSCATNSGAGGEFNITNIPSGVGYVVTVSAAGYAVQHFPNINVAPGPNNVGSLVLGNLLNLPVQLRPLDPDVNPKVTTVEEGGTAYRYYQVVASDLRQLPGGIMVGLRRSGGGVVPQGTRSSGERAGLITGQPDADGLVRLELPSSSIGSAGSMVTFDVLIGATVKQIFTAKVEPRKYQQVWKKKWHGVAGADVKVGLASSGALGFGHETTVTREFANGVSKKEVIGHRREEVYQLGVGIGGSLRINRIGGGGSVGLKGEISVGLGQSFHFEPETADPLDNLWKFYAAYADALNFVPFGGSIIEGVQQQITSSGPVETTEGAIRVTGSGEVEAGIGGLSPLPGDVAFHFWATGSGDLHVEFGIIKHPNSYIGRYLEFGAGWSRDVQWNLDTINANSQAIFEDRDNSLRATIRRTADDKKTKELMVESTVDIASDTPRTIGGWRDDLLLLKSQEVAEYKTTCTLSAPSTSTILPIAINAWQALNDLGQGGVFGPRDGAELVSSLLSSGQTVTYEKSVYSAKATIGSVLPNFSVVLSLDAAASDERGAEIKKQSGVIWKNLLLVRESYPDKPEDYYPTQTLSDLQGIWMGNARAPLDELLNKAQTTVNAAAETVLEAGREGAAALVRIGQGVMSGGAQVTTTWIQKNFGGQLTPNFALQNSPQKSLMGVLPVEGASNYAYGVGGVYRFESTNAFNGTATLTIPYSDAEVAGLNESDLRIYQLPDGTNRWRLVGGVVNALSNSVTATITNLGTFAIAPPLPAGDLALSAAPNSLTANGVATSVITVSNLMLNNGQMATQSWLYTVAASGMEIVEADVTTNYSDVQLVSTNGVLRFTVRAPLGGHSAKIAVASVVGYSAGELGINLVDNMPPLAPAGVTVSAGQSRLQVGWQTNAETDLAGYRVYYRAGSAGPPWDGTAAVEGSSSPVAVAGTNVTLRGLASGANYFVALASVDTTGNESAPTVVGPFILTNIPPQPPRGVVVSFGAEGMNFLSWALSEDDGYNDRDVARYDIYRAILPGGWFVKIGEAPAGVGVFGETNVPVTAGGYLRYAVRAVDRNGQASVQMLANRFQPGGDGVDNDGDGMSDDWELGNGLDPNDPSDARLDWDEDGANNLAEYLAGTDPRNAQSYLQFSSIAGSPEGGVSVAWGSVAGRVYTLLRSTTLDNSGFTPLGANIASTPPQNVFMDSSATNSGVYFYRLRLE